MDVPGDFISPSDIANEVLNQNYVFRKHRKQQSVFINTEERYFLFAIMHLPCVLCLLYVLEYWQHLRIPQKATEKAFRGQGGVSSEQRYVVCWGHEQTRRYKQIEDRCLSICKEKWERI